MDNLEVENVDSAHHYVALSSIFFFSPDHCSQSQKICRQSYFSEKLKYFALDGR